MLWRSANLYNAAFIFTINKRYQESRSDTMHTPGHIPLFHFETIHDLKKHLPEEINLCGVEMHPEAEKLSTYKHPACGAYLLGAEDKGLSLEAIKACQTLIQIETPKEYSMNVAVAGTLLMHDRYIKQQN